MTERSDQINTACFSPDGKLIVSGNQKGIIALWDAESGTCLREWENMLSTYAKAYPVYRVIFAPSGEAVISGGEDHTIKIWDVQDSELIGTLAKHYRVTSLDISQHGLLVSGSAACLNADSSITLWDVKTCKPMRSFNDGGGDVRCVALSPDATVVASNSSDTSICLRHVSNGQRLAQLKLGTAVNSLCFSGDGKYLAAGEDSSQIVCFDVNTRKEIRTYVSQGEDLLSSLCFSRDRKYLAAGTYAGSLTVWELSSGSEVVYSQCEGPILTCSFHPDSKELRCAAWISSGIITKTVRIRQEESGVDLITSS